jgi:hypothetical protein
MLGGKKKRDARAEAQSKRGRSREIACGAAAFISTAGPAEWTREFSAFGEKASLRLCASAREMIFLREAARQRLDPLPSPG